MGDVITAIPIALSSQQRDELNGVFSSPGYSLLKRVLASHCLREMVIAANKGLYESTSEIALTQSKHHRSRAEYINALLDVLDDIEAKEDEWFIASLECKR